MSSGLLYNQLNSLLDNGIGFFKEDSHGSSELILKSLKKIRENLNLIKPIAKDVIEKHAGRYDVSPGLQANGYRSLLRLVECLLVGIIQILQCIESDRTRMFFRANEHLDKLEMYSDILHQLRALLYYAQHLIEITPNGELFVDEEQSAALMHDCEIMAKACFYGSLHGFQYCDGLQPVVHTLSTFVAQYNEVHKRRSDIWTWFRSAIHSSRYVVSPDLRGEKLEQVYNGGDVEFFKNFWSLHEHVVAQTFPNLVGTSVQVNRVFQIPSISFSLPSCHNPSRNVEIQAIQMQEDKDAYVKARLLSTLLRERQNDSNSPSNPDWGFDASKVGFRSPEVHPKSKCLVFFCHGGGFIALTSKSYELILRDWCKELDCPIFCVDYSLAPEDPFPRAFEECFYAYAWALNNAHLLGTTAEKIVFVGDSAGGNFVLSVALRAGQCGIRVPDCIIAIYPACIVRYSASPARLMSVMDPLLPLGVLSGCLSAYSGAKTERIKRSSASSSDYQSPLDQPVEIKYLTNLFKDVEASITRNYLSASGACQNMSTWWDGDLKSPFYFNTATTVPSEEKSPSTSREDKPAKNFETSLNKPINEFKMKLPFNFQPLRSKFCGDSFYMHPSSLVKSPFMSPALADDALMTNLPHVDIVGCEFDPLFDDSIVLAKRLEKLQKSYRLHVVKGLPHGFLNFQIAKEAREASNLCLDLVKQGLIRTKP